MGELSEIDLRPEPASVHRARSFVTRTLNAWKLEALADTATLLASELVTNGVLHARTRLRLSLARDGDRVTIEVRDGSSRPASLVPVGAERNGGRGLTLVDGLSDDWGTREDPAGKAVWCVVSAPPAV